MQGKAPYREENNQKQGRTGAVIHKVSGPAASGGDRGNAAMGGGVNRSVQAPRGQRRRSM